MTRIQQYNIKHGTTTTTDVQHRTEACVDVFLAYVIGGGGNPSANKLAWAQGAIGNSAGIAGQAWPLVIQDAGFGTALNAYVNGDDAAGDAALQPIVEAKLSLLFGSGW